MSHQPDRRSGPIAVPKMLEAPREGAPCGAPTLPYDRVVTVFLTTFMRNPRDARALWSALDAACAELAVEGALPLEEAGLLRAAIARDISHAASVLIRGSGDDIEALASLVHRPGALRCIFHALRLSGDSIYRIAGEAVRVQLRRAGEPTCAGTLLCTHCGESKRIAQAATLSPCQACGGQQFAKRLRA